MTVVGVGIEGVTVVIIDEVAGVAGVVVGGAGGVAEAPTVGAD